MQASKIDANAGENRGHWEGTDNDPHSGALLKSVLTSAYPLKAEVPYISSYSPHELRLS